MKPDEIQQRLAGIPFWKPDGACREISRLFSFPSYGAGLSFVNSVAALAEAENHHPEMVLGYKKVRVSYTTHSEGGLSELDFGAAGRIDAIAGVK